MKMIFNCRSRLFPVPGYLPSDSGFARHQAYGADALAILVCFNSFTTAGIELHTALVF
ncbi:hypothetical protein [Candidatus Methylospira mobilis]|uniref:hypothetical protein n=1 Tax=Candidatus Methylospira mobilis TaxID=1808979 RepID=UPI001293BE28|nr:hypothetical protein [Candidatus Methylospira mobilis]